MEIVQWQPKTFLLALGVAGSLIYFAATLLARMSCAETALAVIVVSIPIWIAQRERALSGRRILLDGATCEHSMLRRLFWSGQITSALLFVIAPFLGLVALVLASQLQREHWFALGFALLLFAILTPLLYRIFGSGLKLEYGSVIMRRWPLRFTFFALTVLSMLWVDFAIVGAPDLRAMHWREIVTDTFEQTRGRFDCGLIGATAGVAEAARALGWHLAQIVIPGQPAMEIRVVAWLLFLLPSGLLALTISTLVCGVIALTENRRKSNQHPREKAFSLGFFAVIALAAVITIYAKSRISAIDPALFAAPVVAVGALLDPCRSEKALTEAETAALKANAGNVVRETQAKIDAARGEHIESAVATIFAGAEGRVDEYLDWYFTVTGEYSRLVAAVAGGFPELMQRRLEETVFGGVNLEGEITDLRETVLASTLESYLSVASDTRQGLEQAITDNSCLKDFMQFPTNFNVGTDVRRAASAFATGSVVGSTASAALAKKVVSSTLAKVATKQSFKLAAGAAVKAASKKGGASLMAAGAAAAICAPSGPIAILCGAGAGAIAWLGTDKLFIEVDEALHREDMKADILATLNEARDELGSHLRSEQIKLSNHLSAAVQSTVDGVFVPRRDGL